MAEEDEDGIGWDEDDGEEGRRGSGRVEEDDELVVEGGEVEGPVDRVAGATEEAVKTGRTYRRLGEAPVEKGAEGAWEPG